MHSSLIYAETAKAIVERHGHFAAVTADGLLVICEAVYTDGRDDGATQEQNVLAILPGDVVRARDVYAWLDH